MVGYERDIELKMQRLLATLSEKDQRRYAGIEAAKLGYGGIEYVSGFFGMEPKTVRRGLTELEQADNLAPDRVRKKGGDRNWRTTFAKFSPNLRQAIRCGRACCGPTCHAVKLAAV
jgi:hypothetical protein